MKFLIASIFALLALSCVVSAVPYYEIRKALDEMDNTGDFNKFYEIFGQLVSDLQNYEVVTMFVPGNMAFFNKNTFAYILELTRDELDLVAKFHAMPLFEDFQQNFDKSKPTMAVTPQGILRVNIMSHHNVTFLYTKEKAATVTRILAEQPHLRIYEIDNVLIPSELLSKLPVPPPPSPQAPRVPASAGVPNSAFGSSTVTWGLFAVSVAALLLLL